MSTDYFLWSPSGKRAVMVGSWGMSGVQAFPTEPDVGAFIRWAIEEGISDITLTSEHDLELLDLEYEQLIKWASSSAEPPQTSP